eukprot:2799637-Prorocentrum_lima.AAC.1
MAIATYATTTGHLGALRCGYSTASAETAHQGHHPDVAKHLRTCSASCRRTVASIATICAR